jgi:hypothetical protein
MNTKLHKLALALAVLLALTLSGCVLFGEPLDSENREKIDQQIREAIEKTFPLPEQVVIRTHVGDDLRFSTNLSVDEVVAFYRDAYSQRGYEEQEDSQISEKGAVLLFKKDGELDVALEVTKNEQGSDVHIQLKPPSL